MTFDAAVFRGMVAMALAASVCIPEVPVGAQSAPVRVSRPVQGSGAVRPRATTIQGTAWRADNTPIPGALLRLRNVITGKIEATAVADAAGGFVFRGLPEGTYLVELVNEGGKVLAVGHVFTIGRGETVATFVRLGAKVPWFNGFFGNAALAVAATAATAGVVALAPEVMTSVSPNR